MREGVSIIKFAEVLEVRDDNYGLRIKVRLSFEDNNIKDDKDLPWAFPLLPKMLHINPKKGEMVLIILQEEGNSNGNRFFIGPIISQPYFMDYEGYVGSAGNMLKGQGIVKPLPNPIMDNNNRGTLPNREDIAIEGRGNSDMILKDNELLLRCGYKYNNRTDKVNSLNFNDIDPSYIMMKYKELQKDAEGNYYNSSVNIVSDRINILSHDSLENVNLTDRESLISEQEMERLLKKAHSLPYGDLLVDFLKEFVRIFLNHTHPFNMDEPVLINSDKEILNQDLSKLISKNIKIL